MKQRFAAVSALGLGVLFAGPALAFEPIAYKDVPSLVGKQVWVAANVGLDGDAWAYAGEPVTVVAAEPFGDQDKGPVYNFIQIKTAEGKSGEVQLRMLSKKALKFNLRTPGTAPQLVIKVLDDAYELPQRMHQIRERYRYDLDSSKSADEYHQVDSMEEYFRFAKSLVHNLVYSSHRSKEDLMREGQTKWLALAKDDKLLDWYADGIKDKKVKAKLVGAKDCLDALDNVSSHGFDIARLEQEKTEKSWRRGMEGVPENKIKKIEAEKVGELNSEIKKKEKQITETFARAAKLKSKTR
ncbi:MAG: hypothetical protein IT384_21625 [Deltaproteobacteria bacterium]|nr:hypothetical protein [Deltaproteobacteria bacterium]